MGMWEGERGEKEKRWSQKKSSLSFFPCRLKALLRERKNRGVQKSPQIKTHTSRDHQRKGEKKRSGVQPQHAFMIPGDVHHRGGTFWKGGRKGGSERTWSSRDRICPALDSPKGKRKRIREKKLIDVQEEKESEKKKNP